MTEMEHLRRALVQKLESLHRCGVRELPRSSVRRSQTDRHSQAEQPSASATATEQPGPSPSAPPAGVVATDADLSDRVSMLRILADEVAACQRCDQLASTRKQTVFGVGNPHARLLFLGEAPGADEDRQGEPFVGRAGQLLTKIIEACTLTREDVYIMNVLKCRPPGNRNPAPEEVQNCRPFLEKQIDTIRPEFICCLGAIAANTLLENAVPVGRLRGQFHDWRGTRVLVTYHPSYLLRNPSAKKLVWADMKLLMREMGVAL